MKKSLVKLVALSATAMTLANAGLVASAYTIHEDYPNTGDVTVTGEAGELVQYVNKAGEVVEVSINSVTKQEILEDFAAWDMDDFVPSATTHTYTLVFETATTTGQTSYEAETPAEAEEYFRAYVTRSGLGDLTWTYDEETLTFTAVEEAEEEEETPEELTTYKLVVKTSDTTITSEYDAADATTAEKYFRNYVNRNGLGDLDWSYDPETHTFTAVEKEEVSEAKFIGGIIEVDENGKAIRTLADFEGKDESEVYYELSERLGKLKADGYRTVDYERQYDEETGSVTWIYYVTEEDAEAPVEIKGYVGRIVLLDKNGKEHEEKQRFEGFASLEELEEYMETVRKVQEKEGRTFVAMSDFVNEDNEYVLTYYFTEAEEEKPETPDKPEKPETPETPEKPEDPKKPEVEKTEAAKEAAKKEELPATGETSNFAVLGAAVLSVLAGLGLVAPKFKKD